MFVANRLPIKNQIPFLIAPGSLAFDDMNMDMSCAIADRKILFLKTFESLVKISGLSYVKRSPAAVFRLFGIDVIGRSRIEKKCQGDRPDIDIPCQTSGPIDPRSPSAVSALCA